MHSPSAVHRNRLLYGLPARELALLVPISEYVALTFGDVLCNAHEETPYAVFPNTGIVSLIATDVEGTRLELGLVGRDGMLGVSLAVDITDSLVAAQVQGAGHAIRFGADRFREALPGCEQLRMRLHRYTYSLMAQITQTAVCNTFHAVDARSARWMLATGDRMHSSDFTMTQALLASMLGVQRPAVSHAASALSEAGLIRYSRGEVSILDRPGLEAVACSCYRMIDDLYRSALA